MLKINCTKKNNGKLNNWFQAGTKKLMKEILKTKGLKP